MRVKRKREKEKRGKIAKELVSPTLLILVFAAAALFSGCSWFGNNDPDNNSGSSGVKLSGTLSTVLSRNFGSDGASRSLSEANQVWAFPVGEGIDSNNMGDMIKADIEDDGKFSFTIPPEPGEKEDWMLLLADTEEQERVDVISGYIALGDINDNLIKLPVNDASGDVDLGSMESDGQEVAEQDSLEGQEANFNLTLDQLKEMAKTDNLLKMVRTMYANYDEDSEIYWTVKPTYMWNLTGSGQLQEVKNSSIEPATYLDTTVVYNLDFNVNDPSIGEGVANGNYNVYLIAPKDVQIEHNETEYTPDRKDIRLAYADNDTSTDTHVDTATDTFGEVFYKSSDNSSRFSLPFVVGEPAQGFWVLKKDTDGDYGETIANDTNLAVLDMSNADPIVEDSSTGDLYYQIYVPVPKINVDSSGIVTSVDISWYMYDPDSSKYELINDTKVLEDTAGQGLYISLNNAEDGAPDTSLGITDTSWDVSSSSLAWSDVWKVAIEYEIMGNAFRFELGD